MDPNDKWSEYHLYNPPPITPRGPAPAPPTSTIKRRLVLAAALVPLVLIVVAAVTYSGTKSRTPAAGSTDSLGLDAPPTTAHQRGDVAPPRTGKTLFGTLPTAFQLHISRAGAESAVWQDVGAAAFDFAHPKPVETGADCVKDTSPNEAGRAYVLTDSANLYGTMILIVSDFGSNAKALAFAKAHVTNPAMDCLQQRYKDDLVSLTGGASVSADSVTEADGFGTGSYAVRYSAQYSIGNHQCTQYRHVTWTVVDTAVVTGDFESCFNAYDFQAEAGVVTKIEDLLKQPAPNAPAPPRSTGGLGA